MKKTALFLIGWFIIIKWVVSSVFAAAGVLELDEDSFDTVIEEEGLIMVEFFAPWCGYCKRLEPEYATAAKELANVCKLASVDCTQYGDLCNQYGVRGYPTLKIFRDKVPSDYDGERTSEAITRRMKLEAQSPVVIANSRDQIEALSQTHPLVVVGFFENEKQSEYKAFEAVSQKLRGSFGFAVCFDSTTTKDFNVTKTPAAILLKTFDEGQSIFRGRFLDGELESFLTVHSLPLLDEIGPENFLKYKQSGLPLAYLFVESEDQRSGLGSSMKEIAQDFRGRVNFVYVNATKYGGFANTLNLKGGWPAFAIHDHHTNGKYPIRSSQTLSKDVIHQFTRDVLEGKAKPFLKSQAIPEDNDGDVTAIVGSEFNSIVMDKDKDVLVEFYAPWCGYCKKLAPTYEKLGELFSGNKKIVIANMDATENDLPLGSNINIEGFPTIILFKANPQKESVVYRGDRSLKDLVNFIKENAVNQVTNELEGLKDEL